ncbi:hypothetical protein NL676_029935 [Syzygium grande]|nr:hypothetical protein NL676_029935 [Syzygium grande]
MHRSWLSVVVVSCASASFMAVHRAVHGSLPYIVPCMVHCRTSCLCIDDALARARASCHASFMAESAAPMHCSWPSVAPLYRRRASLSAEHRGRELCPCIVHGLASCLCIIPCMVYGRALCPHRFTAEHRIAALFMAAFRARIMRAASFMAEHHGCESCPCIIHRRASCMCIVPCMIYGRASCPCIVHGRASRRASFMAVLVPMHRATHRSWPYIVLASCL